MPQKKGGGYQAVENEQMVNDPLQVLTLFNVVCSILYKCLCIFATTDCAVPSKYEQIALIVFSLVYYILVYFGFILYFIASVKVWE